MWRNYFLTFVFCSLLTSHPFVLGCEPYTNAADHIGEVACIKGRIVKVGVGATGIHFLNYCEDYKLCPFTVVVFPRDLRDVGDVRALEGQEIEVTGKIQSYKGQAEIILKDRSQLNGEFGRLPKLPKGYEASKKGTYSAGKYKSPSSTGKTPTRSRPRDPIQDDE